MTKKNNISNNETVIKQNIRQKMCEQLRCDLTIGMEDLNQQAYNEEDIILFLTQHVDDIENAVNAMLEAYKEDNTLSELGDGTKGEDDWYREFLYEHVKTPNDNIEEE